MIPHFAPLFIENYPRKKVTYNNMPWVNRKITKSSFLLTGGELALNSYNLLTGNSLQPFVAELSFSCPASERF